MTFKELCILKLLAKSCDLDCDECVSEDVCYKICESLTPIEVIKNLTAEEIKKIVEDAEINNVIPRD